MRPETHPTWHPKAKVTCACGHSFHVGSTVEEMHVEICSNCHPFYTGKQKLIDTARRVERFEARIGKRDAAAAARKGRKLKKAKAAERRTAKRPKMEREEGMQKAPPAGA